jgi:hypothetical protein
MEKPSRDGPLIYDEIQFSEIIKDLWIPLRSFASALDAAETQCRPILISRLIVPRKNKTCRRFALAVG